MPRFRSVALIGFRLPITGCGSSGLPAAQKQARIEKALRLLRYEDEQDRRKLERDSKPGEETLGSITLYSKKPPPGIGAAEWNAAIHLDETRQHGGHER